MWEIKEKKCVYPDYVELYYYMQIPLKVFIFCLCGTRQHLCLLKVINITSLIQFEYLCQLMFLVVLNFIHWLLLLQLLQSIFFDVVIFKDIMRDSQRQPALRELVDFISLCGGILLPDLSPHLIVIDGDCVFSCLFFSLA